MKQSVFSTLCAAAMLSLGATSTAQAGPNPTVPFYGWGAIVATPSYPIVGEQANITVRVDNTGDAEATNVRVKLSYNDWGVTFFGWQEIGEVTIPSIAAGGTFTASFDYVFENAAHTCLEALVTGSDADDNENDNRGQINLEIINVGDTFDYWVPIVNEGDEPIQVLVVPHCGAGDPAGGGGADQNLCRDNREQIVDVAPGEEVLIPIHVDLRAIPPGGEVIVQVDAYNLLADNPFGPDNHNHVQIVVRRAAARALKAQSHAMLQTLAANATGGDKGKLSSAAKHLENALAPGNWVDANHITKKGGASVFAQELAAVNTLQNLLAGGLPTAVKAQIDEVIRNLTDADRILATSSGNAGATFVGVGDAEREAGNYGAAITAYKHAWQANR